MNKFMRIALSSHSKITSTTYTWDDYFYQKKLKML